MPRSEQPLGPGDDSLTAFAGDLRKLRAAAGGPPYRELARRAHYSATTLADAAGGKRLPSLPATLAFVRACEGDPVDWEQRWHSVAADLAAQTEAVQEPGLREPYAGLAAFQAEDADRFFGREALVEHLVGKVTGNRFLAVFGASGAGKSSLLRAGLIASVPQWPVVLMTPGRRPMEECAIQLAAPAGESAPALLAELNADAGNLNVRVRQTFADRDLLLVVDQFEEVFTLCQDPAERDRFLAALLNAAQSPTSRVRVVLGVRTDFYTHCAAYPELVAALQDAQVLVGPMSAEQLRSAITRPAVDLGYRLDSALLATIMAETAGQPGVLPLVSHALLETWRRRTGTRLTEAGYHASGGISHAIARTADSVYEQLDAAQQAVARDLFLRLTALGEGTEDTKRRVYHRELGPDIAVVVDRLTRARLITADQDGLEITHEALIRCWPRLRGWLNADREGLRVHRLLTEATDTWESLNRDPAALYRGVRLEQASTCAAALTVREQDFLRASESARDEEEAKSRRVNRRLRQLVAAVVVFALLAVSAAVVAIEQRATAVGQRDDAVFRQVLAQADRLQDNDPSLSAQLNLVAHRMRPADQNVHTRLMSTGSAPLATPLTGHTANVYLTTFSPDGRTLATASEDKTARLWDVADPARPKPLGEPLTGHTGWLSAAVFSPDGRTLATTGDDGTVGLWNVSDPAHPARLGSPLSGGDGSIYLLAFSPDGRTLATANENKTVRLWNVANPADTVSLTGPAGPVRSLAFSRDGRLLAAGGDDSTVRLWNVADRTPFGQPLTGHTSIVHSVAFSPDGKILATGSRDTTVRLWNVADGTPLGVPLTAHTGAVWSVTFNRDGSTLATGSADSTARLWNVSDPASPVQLGPRLSGSTANVYAVGFSPDGRFLATGGADSTVRLWSLPTALLIGHRVAVNFTAFSPDGKVMATGAKDNTVRLWNTADPMRPLALGEIPAAPGVLQSCTDCQTHARFSRDGRMLAVLTHAKLVQLWNIADPARPALLSTLPLGTRYTASLAVSPDGRTLGTKHDDNTMQLWDITDPARPAPLARFSGHDDKINASEFSPDGRLLATTSVDRTIRLWDVTDRNSPKPLHRLTGHTGAVGPLAFSPDGRTLASAGNDQTVRLWNVADGTPLGVPLTGHTKNVSAVVFSPDGRTLASASSDQTIRLWNVADGTPLGQPMTTFGGTGSGLAFSPDGRFLASADGADTVRLLELDTERAVERICATTRGQLTRQQWELYLPDLPYQPPCGD